MEKGFVFSLDAFVALMLMLLAISTIIAMGSTPKNYYMGLEQASDLAKDTLESMRTTQWQGHEMTYLDAVVLNNADSILAISESAEKAIPQQYGFRFEKYDARTNTIIPIYDTQDRSPQSSHRFGRTQKKLSAVSSMFYSAYDTETRGTTSPFCYWHCSGTSIPFSPAPPPNEGTETVFPIVTDAEGKNSEGGNNNAGAFGKTDTGAGENSEIAPGGTILPPSQTLLPGTGSEIAPGGTITPGSGTAGTITCMTPCDAPQSLFRDGDVFIGQIRLVVYS